MNVENPNAFPVSSQTAKRINEGYGSIEEEMGMSLRDYFAAKAMQGIISNPGGPAPKWDKVARDSYAAADAMLEERSKTDKS